ncbi:Rossmann-like and DUF2520 domain-containing protein [Alicyclobacillus mengziensis]|uniref:DUF2520 domain-containing protein n=1 Tax=Alicyclobacillus mengziensis TaxID=2931921 RepID=A0A9X7Z729_9BACL|nr:Rossmann-like and DUF2520 domain-containing protein [Alicyclobacillus mengziensis]QSO47011.1 DUF2520 domain-containing protein [Alicyclobacillus mengziensis]
MLRVIFVGCGRVGTTLAMTLVTLGHDVLCGLTPRPNSPSAGQFKRATGTDVFLLTSDEAIRQTEHADVIFITTPDKAVTETAQTLCDLGMVHAGQTVIHTSGSLGSDALFPVKAQDALTLSLHPLQTIASATAGRATLDGIYCTLEGDPSALEIGMSLVYSWGGIPVEISPSLRPQYHAAAVLASNAVVALAAVASELSGIPQGLSALLPLMKGAVRNLETLGLPSALTGPIERGDLATVQAHVKALEHNPTAKSVYTALGRATADVAVAKGTLSPAMRQKFTDLFSDTVNKES